MLPLGYSLRNLWRRRARTAITLIGLAATTLLVIAMVAFARGLGEAAHASAREDVMVLVGSSAELDLVRSVVTRGHAEDAAASAPGVLEVDGLRAASVELHVASRRGSSVGLLRGVTASAYLVHPQVSVVEGREPREPFELMAGSLAASRMGLPESELAVGSSVELEGRPWKVSGRFVAPGTVFEGELWLRLDDLMLASRREDVSCIALRLADASRAKRVDLFAARRVDLEVAAVSERELLRSLSRSLEPIAMLAKWMAALAVLAGAFACANTMFAAVLARTKELATLRAIGFGSVSLSFTLLTEALLLALLGGAVGCLVAYALGSVPLRFPMGVLRIEFEETNRAIGLAAALISGILGGLVPAWRAVRLPWTEAIGGRA